MKINLPFFISRVSPAIKPRLLHRPIAHTHTHTSHYQRASLITILTQEAFDSIITQLVVLLGITTAANAATEGAMETNAVAVWWYWWVRAREGMRHVDSAGGGRQIMVNFQTTAGDEGGRRIETRVRFVPMPTLASHTATATATTEAPGGGPRDADAEEGGPYESRYEAWLRGLSERSRRFVEREGRAARHCSALLYRFNRPLWRTIDQGLSDTVTDLLEAGMRDGRIEARVVDRVRAGARGAREIQFVRTGEGAAGAPLVAELSPSAARCDDIILNNRKMYTPASLRRAPLATRETGSLTKSGRRRHRARRYRAARRLVVTVPAADTDTETGSEGESEAEAGGATNEGGEGAIPRGTVDPLQLWPRASYVRDTTTYL